MLRENYTTKPQARSSLLCCVMLFSFQANLYQFLERATQSTCLSDPICKILDSKNHCLVGLTLLAGE